MCAAPITAANLAANFSAGLYNGLPLSVNGVSVLAGTPAPEAEDSAFDEDARDAPSGLKAPSSLEVGTSGGDVGGRRMAPTALPLEILAAGDFEPVYRSTLDVRSGELPVLPLSIYGAGKLLQAGVYGLAVTNAWCCLFLLTWLVPRHSLRAVAMAHLPDSSGSGYVSGTQFFIYKFDRTQASLNCSCMYQAPAQLAPSCITTKRKGLIHGIFIPC